MPREFPLTAYGWTVEDLRDTAEDLLKIALETTDGITEVEAALAHYHLSIVLYLP